MEDVHVQGFASGTQRGLDEEAHTHHFVRSFAMFSNAEPHLTTNLISYLSLEKTELFKHHSILTVNAERAL